MKHPLSFFSTARVAPLLAAGLLSIAAGYGAAQDAPATPPPAAPTDNAAPPDSLFSPEDFAAAQTFLNQTGLSVDLAPDPFTPSVRLYLTNRDTKSMPVQITLSNDENFLGTPRRRQSATVPPKSKLQVRFLLPGAAMAPDSRYAFTADITATPSVSAANPTEDPADPTMKEGQDLVVDNPAPSREEIAAAKAGEDPDDLNLQHLPIAGAANLGTHIKAKRMLSFFQIERTGQAPSFDGTMNGWLNASMIVVSVPGRARGSASGWHGNADKTSSARFLWDAKNLYMMIRCTDDVERLAASPTDPNGDRVRVAISPTGAHLPDSTWVEMDVVPLGTGKVIATRKASASLKLKDGLVNSVRSGYKVENGVNVFLAAIPWKELGVNSGKTTLPLGLTVRALDDDGQGIKSWLDWGGGAGAPADPTSFSDVALGS